MRGSERTLTTVTITKRAMPFATPVTQESSIWNRSKNIHEKRRRIVDLPPTYLVLSILIKRLMTTGTSKVMISGYWV